MELFLDSTDIDEIKHYNSFGIIDGVTTNPTLMANSKQGFYETVKSICSLVKDNVSVEIVADDYENMIIQGEKLIKIAENIVIKIPITWEGIKACKYFSSKGVKTNMTLCFSVNQALIAAKVGATYVSPFVGRFEDQGESGIVLISDIRSVYDNYDIETKILAASIRTPKHLTEVAICGADVSTLPAKVLSTLLNHPLTDKGLKKFNQDWLKSGMKI
jgi:transaldolase